MSVESKISAKATDIEALMYKYLPDQISYQKTIKDAMNYSLFAGGKRIRPMLMNETYKLFGGKERVIEPFMVAMECIHTYSLVHDDLPAMDNDMYRRGKLTTHAKYGEAMAILCGDALLNYAFEIAASAFDLTDDKDGVIKALKILSKKAGIYGMIGGQVVDVEAEGTGDMTEDKLSFIYDLKTGALIEASMMIGAALAGASDLEIETVEKVASKVGLAFQIQDDILDVIGDQEKLGKDIGSDAKNEKPTFVALYGIDAAKEKVEGLTKESLEILNGMSYENEFLGELLEYLVYRDK